MVDKNLIVTIYDSLPKKGSLVNKDVAGGYGNASYYGEGIIPKLAAFAKKYLISYPPLTLGYICAILKKYNIEVYLAKKVQDIKTNSNLIILYSSIVTCNYDIEQAKKIKNEFLSSQLVVLGPFVSTCPHIYKDYFDTVVVGEAEKYFLESLANNSFPKGAVKAGLIEDLNLLPFPDWSLWKDNFRFVTFPFKGSNQRMFPMLGSRGCTMSCAFYCPYTALAGRNWRKRTPDNISSEIQYLIEKYSAGYLYFRDALFTLDMKRAENIAKEILNKGIKIKYGIETHLKLLSKELVDIMVDSGLYSINVGIESSSEENMENFHRDYDALSHQEEILNYCKKKGILISGFYILGLPTDTKESIKATISYAKKLNLDLVQFSVPTPYPGTPFYVEAVKENLIVDHDFEHYDMQTVVLKHKNLSTQELKSLKEYAYASYYSNPAWILSFVRRVIFKKY